LQKAFWSRTCKDVASIVVATGGNGEQVPNRIIQHEKSWIQNHLIPVSYQEKSPMLHRLINHEGTKLAFRKYLASAGERITSQSVAYAISLYWQTRVLPFEEQPELKNPPLPYAPETEAQLAQLVLQT